MAANWTASCPGGSAGGVASFCNLSQSCTIQPSCNLTFCNLSVFAISVFVMSLFFVISQFKLARWGVEYSSLSCSANSCRRQLPAAHSIRRVVCSVVDGEGKTISSSERNCWIRGVSCFIPYRLGARQDRERASLMKTPDVASPGLEVPETLKMRKKGNRRPRPRPHYVLLR
jgi:hypothetical protein